MKLSSPIMLFIFASAGIHAGVVMTANNASNITLPGSTGSVMAVKIKEIEIDSKKPEKKTKQPKTTAKVNKILAANKKNVKEKPTKHESKLTPSIEITEQAESKARVVSIIYKELSQHFTYPKLAQKRNWQGKVLLSLRVSANGKINNIQINHSSGYRVLDQAAINALIKIGYLPQISSWLDNDVDLKLPVIYQLTEG